VRVSSLISILMEKSLTSN